MVATEERPGRAVEFGFMVATRIRFRYNNSRHRPPVKPAIPFFDYYSMRRPDNPGRRVGSEERLWVLTYSQIAAWVHLAPRTVRSYASEGQFKRDSIESVLQWVNERRRRLGLDMIGQPGRNSGISRDSKRDTLANVTDSSPIDVSPCIVTTSRGLPSGYNPLKGAFDP